MRHLTSVGDLQAGEIETIFSITEDLKTKYESGLRESLLPGRVMALLFEKPSLRTRVSFESGMAHLGGVCLFLGEEAGFGHRESLEDFTRVLTQYVDVLVVRSKCHATMLEIAKHSSCPVINGLTDQSHPCQALADLYTMLELGGSLSGQKLAYVGDANNVAYSLALACARTGVQFAIASPPGYGFSDAVVAELKKDSPNFALELTEDPVLAVQGADAVYTDVWASMGQEGERTKRLKDFAPYQVNAKLMSKAGPKAQFLHCLPARRGEEVTDEVIDSAASVVVHQASNRMHVQKGILAWLLSAQK